jgi:peptide/nickel transport system permease protein
VSTVVVPGTDGENDTRTWRRAIGSLRPVWRTLEGRIGLCLIAFFVIVIIFGPLVAPFGPDTIGVGPDSAGPSIHHLLGTDELGRDVLSRLLYGGRSVIGVPFVAATCALALGGTFGMVAGYRGGVVDMFATRVIDIGLAMPPLLIVLVILSVAGSSPVVVIICVTAVYSTRIARVLRGATQGVVANNYVQAAQARGERTLAIIFREVLPNIMPTVLVEFALRFAYTIIFVATLNFLGLGLQPPSPNWGVAAAEEQSTLALQPLATLAPTIAIGLLAISIGLVADATTRAYGISDSRGEFLR